MFFMYICKPRVLRFYLDRLQNPMNEREAKLKRGGSIKVPRNIRYRTKDAPKERGERNLEICNAEKIESKNMTNIREIGIKNKACTIVEHTSVDVDNQNDTNCSDLDFSSSTHHQRELSIARTIGAELVECDGGEIQNNMNLHPGMKDEGNLVKNSHVERGRMMKSTIPNKDYVV